METSTVVRLVGQPTNKSLFNPLKTCDWYYINRVLQFGHSFTVTQECFVNAGHCSRCSVIQ